MIRAPLPKYDLKNFLSRFVNAGTGYVMTLGNKFDNIKPVVKLCLFVEGTFR
jgi:hypothetical protein